MRRAALIRPLLAGLCTLLLAAPAALAAGAADSELLATVSARLAAETAVDQRFVQEKQLRILKRPIRTEGVMLYRREQGVCWHTEKPVASTLVLGEHELRQIDAGNELVLKAEQQPALFGFTQLFFAALSGQVATLGEHFTMQVHGNADAWQLELVPKDALLRRFIEQMELRGGARIERVRILDRGGDTTEIQFSALAAGGADAGALERSCFVR